MARQRRRRQVLATTAPDESALRKALDELLALHEEWSNISVAHSKERSFRMKWGLIAHTIAHAEAGLILLDHPNLQLCAETSARVAFEHALLAQYAHQHPDGEVGLLRLMEYYDYRLGVTMSQLNLDGDLKDLAFQSAQAKTKAPDIANFSTLTEQFDTSGWLYASYKMLCQSVHPSSFTLARYLIVNEESGRTRSVLRYARPEGKEPMLWTLTLSVLLALGVQEDTRKGKSNMSRLRRVGARVGMTPLLDLA